MPRLPPQRMVLFPSTEDSFATVVSILNFHVLMNPDRSKPYREHQQADNLARTIRGCPPLEVVCGLLESCSSLADLVLLCQQSPPIQKAIRVVSSNVSNVKVWVIDKDRKNCLAYGEGAFEIAISKENGQFYMPQDAAPTSCEKPLRRRKYRVEERFNNPLQSADELQQRLSSIERKQESSKSYDEQMSQIISALSNKTRTSSFTRPKTSTTTRFSEPSSEVSQLDTTLNFFGTKSVRFQERIPVKKEEYLAQLDDSDCEKESCDLTKEVSFEASEEQRQNRISLDQFSKSEEKEMAISMAFVPKRASNVSRRESVKPAYPTVIIKMQPCNSQQKFIGDGEDYQSFEARSEGRILKTRVEVELPQRSSSAGFSIKTTVEDYTEEEEPVMAKERRKGLREQAVRWEEWLIPCRQMQGQLYEIQEEEEQHSLASGPPKPVRSIDPALLRRRQSEAEAILFA